MSFPKIKEVLVLSYDEIQQEIMNSKKQLFELRLLKGTKQSFKPHAFKVLKHRLSQLLMVKKQLKSEKEAKK